MGNSASQNPSNKVARNSGAGPAGVSEIVPTPEEARRGLEAFGTRGPESRSRRMIAGIGALALLGAGAAALVRRRMRQPRGRFARVRQWATAR